MSLFFYFYFIYFFWVFDVNFVDVFFSEYVLLEEGFCFFGDGFWFENGWVFFLLFM